MTLAETAQAILRARDADFATLARIGGLDPARHFRGADLRNVDFGDDDLSGFDFREADFAGADLSRARGLRSGMFAGAKCDAGTRAPEWLFGPPKSGWANITERDVRVQRAQQAAAILLSDWTPEEIKHFIDLGYPSYWLSFDSETHSRHAQLVRDAERRKSPLTVDMQPLPLGVMTEITVYCADYAGLFSKISGALAVARASIVEAHVHTLTNGMALITVWVQDVSGGVIVAPHRLAQLSVLIEQALSGRLRLASEIRKASKTVVGQRMRAIDVPPRVVIDNHASPTYTVLEVNGRDWPGLMHDLTAAISEKGLQIAYTRVITDGVSAVAVFYVKDVFERKVESDRRLVQLHEALLFALKISVKVDSPARVRRSHN
jgi:[protein-PII] uridylyltransferase